MPAGSPIAVRLNDLALDVAITTPARGDILYRGSAKWNNLPAGTAGHILKTGGAGADPSWSDTLPSLLIGTGTMSVGTSGAGVLVLGNSTAPTSAPADEVQLFSSDYAAGDARLQVLSESGTGLWVGNGTLEAVAPASGAGTSLTLRASNAASGNSNGGSINLTPGLKSGSGSDGQVLLTRGKINRTGLSSPDVYLECHSTWLSGHFLKWIADGNGTDAFGISGNNAGYGGITIYSAENNLTLRGAQGRTSGIGVLVLSSSAAVNPLAIRGVASQTGNLLELQTSTPNTYAYIPPGSGATGTGSGIYFKNNGTGYLGLTAGANLIELGLAGSTVYVDADSTQFRCNGTYTTRADGGALTVTPRTGGALGINGGRLSLLGGTAGSSGDRNGGSVAIVGGPKSNAGIDGDVWLGYDGITARGNVVVGGAALSTSATDGFFYIPTCAGTPTGTPTTYTGRSPIVYDTTNNRLYVYAGGSWQMH